MTTPPTYNRVYNFTGFQAAAPSTPLPANEVDAELSAIKITLDAIIAALSLIQRSDGQLANATVGPVQLSPSLNLGFSPATAWTGASGLTYSLGNCVFYTTKLYVCITSYTTGVSPTTPDLDATHWMLLADFTGNVLPAGSVTTAALGSQVVTQAKMAAGAVGPTQLAPLAVTTAAIAASAVTGTQIAASTIDFSKINTSGLPTVLPGSAGVWWLDGGVLSLSQ